MKSCLIGKRTMLIRYSYQRVARADYLSQSAGAGASFGVPHFASHAATAA